MRQFLLTLILLTTVVLSTGDVLPILSIKQIKPELVSSEDHVTNNIINDRFRNNDLPNDIFYKVSIGSPRNAYTPLLIPQKSSIVYVRDDNPIEGIENFRVEKKDKYDGKGFRKEQWHNYPRQLDRLQKDLYRYHQFDDGLNPDPDDPEDVSNDEMVSNEIHGPINSDKDVLDAVVAATSPLLILKIRLAYLKNDLQNIDLNEFGDTVPIELVPSDLEDEDIQQTLDPIIGAVKVKREGISSTKGFSDKATDGKKTVKKRIFSLWSRLQSMSHKGHELHHRRHLHAFYGFPNDDGSGGGTLTAETRASFIRPPGSPLRWG